MKKIFAQNVLFLLLVNLLIKPLWIFGIDLQVHKVLGNEIYGSYQAFVSFCIIFQIMLDMGLQNYSNKVVAQSHGTFSSLFPNIIIAKLGLSALYLVTITSVAFALQYTTAQIGLLLLVAVCQIIQSYYLFFRSNVAAKQLFKTDSVLSVLDRFLLILCCGCLLYLPFFKDNFTIVSFILAQCLTLFLSSLIALAILRKHYSVSFSSFKIQKVIVVIKHGLPYALLVFLMGVFMRADQLILKQLLGTEAVGQYSGLFRLLDAANNMSGVLLSSMLLSFFVKHHKDESVINAICKLCNDTFIPLTLLVPVACFFFGNDMMNMLGLHLGIDVDLNLGMLMLAFPAYSLMYIYSSLLTAMGKLKELIKLAVGVVVFNLIFNIGLQPYYGVLGASMVHAATLWLLVIFQIMGSNRSFAAPLMSAKTVGFYVLLVAVSCSIGYLLSGWNISWMVKLAILLSQGTLLIVLLNAKDIKLLLQKVTSK